MDHNRSTAHSLSHNHHGHHGPSSRLSNASNSVTHGHNVLNDRRELASDSIYSLLENSHIVATEKVQSLAGRIYQEFERMISRYDEEVVKSLMPLVVNVLENLDSAYQTIREHDVELELLRDDNEQLVAQYEREKSARKSCEQRLLEIEDIYETEKKELLAKQESLESIVRMLELKHKNSLEHASRLEDRELDNKKEYQKLHDRYTDLFKTHLEYVDRTKFLISSSQQQFAASTGQTTAMSASVGSERMTSMMTGSGSNNVTVSTVGGRNQNGPNATTDTGYNMPRSSGPVSFGFSSLEVTSDGIDDSLTTSSPLNRSSSSSTTSIGTPAIQLDSAIDEQNLRKNRRKTTDAMKDESDDDDDDEDAETPHVSPVEELRTVADTLADASKTAIVNETASSSSVIDSTHAKKEERIGNNLYQEFSFQDMEPVQRELEETPDVTGNWVNAGEYASSINDNFFTMGKEVEKLIAENTELLETKNALNVVKNDLITQVDELQSKLDLMQRENDSLSEMKLNLLKRINVLEDNVKKQKEQMDASKEEDEDGANSANGYMAHKKRFTRVEMARVLMERNQYKEKLMELQDSVRWSEYARVSKYSNLDKNKAKTSTFWNIFSKLFTSGGSSGGNSSSTAVAVMTSTGASGSTGVSATLSHPNLSSLSSSLRFNANSNHLIPEITATPLAISSSTSINTEVDEIGSSRLNSNRYRAAKRYDDQRNVQFCDNDDDHRFETSGWRFSPKSIPDVTSPASVGQSMLANSRISVPLPIHCQPIQEHNNNLHLWCGAGVNLFGGFTYDGEQQKEIINDVDNHDATVVASSDSNSSTKSVESGADSRSTIDSENLPQDNDESVRELDTEIEALRTFTNLEMKLSSYVWLCMTSKHLSRVTIINANSPNDVLDNFAVCNDHLLCIGSVPGVTPHEISDISVTHGSIADNLPKLPDNAKDYLLNQLYVVETNFLNESIDKSDSKNAEDVKNVDESGDDEFNRNSKKSRLVKTVLATMWMGSQNHSLYIHSSIDKPEECIASFKLPDSIVSIVHLSGKVVIALANGTVAIFGRQKDGQWDLSRYFVLVLGPPIKSVRCLTVVGNNVWCSCRNRIFVLNPKCMKIVHSFIAEPREELDVRLMTWYADGVWVSTRLSSVLKLFHAFDYSLLQTFSIEPYVNKMLGPGKFGFSFIKVTALLVSAGRLWIGTCYGVILSVPLNDHSAVIHNMTSSGNGAALPRANFNVLPTSISTNPVSNSAGSGNNNSEQRNTPVSKCCTTKTQVSLHGHRDDVKFFVTVPGCGGMSAASTPADAQNKPLTPMSRPTQLPPAMLVLCGGKGYIDFRADDKLEYQDQVPHLLMWQVATV